MKIKIYGIFNYLVQDILILFLKHMSQLGQDFKVRIVNHFSSKLLSEFKVIKNLVLISTSKLAFLKKLPQLLNIFYMNVFKNIPYPPIFYSIVTLRI